MGVTNETPIASTIEAGVGARVGIEVTIASALFSASMSRRMEYKGFGNTYPDSSGFPIVGHTEGDCDIRTGFPTTYVVCAVSTLGLRDSEQLQSLTQLYS